MHRKWWSQPNVFRLIWGPLQGRNDLVDDLADVFFLFFLWKMLKNRIPRAACCWCELFDFFGLLTCPCDLHAGLACNYCLANHYPSDGVCLECVEQDPGFPGMLPWCVGGARVELRCLLGACFLFGGALLGFDQWCETRGFGVCQSEGVAFFFVESWVGLDWKRLYVAYAVVGQRRFFFFFSVL